MPLQQAFCQIGAYRVCWSANGGEDQDDYVHDIGELRIAGPDGCARRAVEESGYPKNVPRFVRHFSDTLYSVDDTSDTVRVWLGVAEHFWVPARFNVRRSG